MPYKQKFQIGGRIVRLKGEKIIIEITSDAFQSVLQWHKSESYDFQFQLNRIPYQTQHHALTFIQSEGLFKTLIKNGQYERDNAHILQPHQRNLDLK